MKNIYDEIITLGPDGRKVDFSLAEHYETVLDSIEKARVRSKVQIAKDLDRVLGWKTRLPTKIISRLGYRLIFQLDTGARTFVYIGIARKGVLVAHRAELDS